jgi:DNA-binding SARP family transcriptional activator
MNGPMTTGGSPCLEIRLLGELQLVLDHHPIDQDMGLRARELAAFLALFPDVLHRREKLMAILWPEKDTERASANLRRALFLLRQALGEAATEVLSVTDTAIGLRSAAARVDRWEIERALIEAENGSPQSGVEVLESYDGDLMGEAPPDWAYLERETLRRRVLAAGMTGVRASQAAGGPAAALVACRRLLAIDPFHEAAHAMAIALLDELGDRSAALAQYELCRELLARELGVTPSAEVEAAYRHALTGAGHAPASATPVPAVPAVAASGSATRPRRRWLQLPAVAGAVAMAAVALFAALTLWQRMAAARQTTDELVNEHIVASSMEQLPVQSADPARIDAWFNAHVPYRVRSASGGPSGWRLFGGGLCDLAGEFAATAVFHGPGGERASVFKFPEGDLPLPIAPELGVSGVRGLSRDGYSIVFWANHGLVYAVVSEIDLNGLARIATHLAGS